VSLTSFWHWTIPWKRWKSLLQLLVLRVVSSVEVWATGRHNALSWRQRTKQQCGITVTSLEVGDLVERCEAFMRRSAARYARGSCISVEIHVKSNLKGCHVLRKNYYIIDKLPDLEDRVA
jgi:hypothetical protein